MGGTDVEADVTPAGQCSLLVCQLPAHLLHEESCHGNDQAAGLCLGDEQVRSHQPHVRVLPAHQHLGPHDASTATLHQGLQIGNELPPPQGPCQLVRRRAGPPQQPPDEQGETGAEPGQQQQPEAVRLQQALPVRGASIPHIDGEGVDRRTHHDAAMGKRHGGPHE